MREHLRKYSVEVEYSSELVALEQFADHATAKVRKGESVEVIDIPFIVGADGGKGELFLGLQTKICFSDSGFIAIYIGTVRKSLGLKFLGETKSDVVWALGDIEVTWGYIDKEVCSSSRNNYARLKLNTFTHSISAYTAAHQAIRAFDPTQLVLPDMLIPLC